MVHDATQIMVKQSIEDEKVINLSAKMQNSSEIYSPVRFYSRVFICLGNGKEKKMESFQWFAHSRSHFTNVTSKTRPVWSIHSMFVSHQLANLSASQRMVFSSSLPVASFRFFFLLSKFIHPLCCSTALAAPKRTKCATTKMFHLIMVDIKRKKRKIANEWFLFA